LTSQVIFSYLKQTWGRHWGLWHSLFYS